MRTTSPLPFPGGQVQDVIKEVRQRQMVALGAHLGHLVGLIIAARVRPGWRHTEAMPLELDAICGNLSYGNDRQATRAPGRHA